jgi:hypothetical protein
MVRAYVAHCPSWEPERRPFLEENLKWTGFDDVVWVTTYPANDPFVLWLTQELGNYLSKEGISGLVKHLEMAKMFIDDPAYGEDDGAIFCDDDVVFTKNWKSAVEQIPAGFPFVNLSVGIHYNLLPNGQPLQLGANNGGCEVFWATKKFCRIFLDNVDARVGADHVFCGLLKYVGIPLYCIPVAQQTSPLIGRRPVDPASYKDYELNWFEFVKQFKPTGLVYEELWKKYLNK